MRLHRVLGALLAGIFLLIPGTVFAQSSEEVTSFQVTALLERDRMLTVTETITYDFGSNERRGIFRYIPTVYERNFSTHNLRLKLLSVQRDGASEPYKTEPQRTNFFIRIGDPEVYLTGVHTYEITYKTNRAINFFEGKGELYWNVTGNDWDVSIRETSFTLHATDGYDSTEAPILCFTGPFGSEESACDIERNQNQVTITSRRPFDPKEGMTVVFRFPEGLIAKPTAGELFWQLLRDNAVFAVPILALIIMLYLWYTKGRDPKGRGTVVPHYDPPRGLTPIEMHALKRQLIHHSAITATLIDLARRGYMQIEFGEEKGVFKSTPTYTFVRLKEEDESLNRYEKKLLQDLWTYGSDEKVELTELKGSFHATIAKLKDMAFAELRQKKLFGANPSSVRTGYSAAGLVVAIATIGIGLMAAQFAAIPAGIVAGLVVAFIGWYMPAKTKEGAVALEEVEGFKWFLSVTEKDRLKFHNAPKLKPEKFHEFLPFAIAFGVEEEWAEQFKGLDIPEPTYATGYGTWNVIYFANSMHALDAKAATTAFAAPSSAGSGGSGFGGGGVGGGFGGGGGGSW